MKIIAALAAISRGIDAANARSLSHSAPPQRQNG
jgi:hypothetical protein